MTSEARDDYGLTESERYETLLQAMGDHHEGKHDWSCVDPYDCVVCHAVIALYTEVVRANASQQPDDAIRVAALEAALSEIRQFVKEQDWTPEFQIVFDIAESALDGAPSEVERLKNLLPVDVERFHR